MSEKELTNNNADLSDIGFVKLVGIGNIDPNKAFTDEEKEQQVSLLNRALSELPKGKIIGKDISVIVYRVGEQEITLQKITYHVGFKRKPHWLD